MSKDDACKVTSASKHKERKPKKPHYIPRPWGKPYNYKCFQCPFTCMEKSHLYNHMKYSLCKNSLSLLIESDWPYKKGNILHPEQLRPFQHGLHAAGKDEAEQAMRAEERQGQRRRAGEEGEDRESHASAAAEEEEEGGGAGEGAESGGLPKEPSKKSRDAAEGKRGKQPETSELLMADMLTLEDQLLRARSVEVEAQLKHYKLSKTCLAAPGLLSEQWRLLASSQTKARAEAATAPRVNSSIPCYPPPPNLVDYQDPTGLNLSVLGVGYPISPGLFSYMNSAMSAPAAGMAAQTHAQLAQLPFLASAAQLMQPASGADRALIPPRLYYPFLCEHSFGSAAAQSEAAKALKTSPNGLEADPLSGFQPKVNLWKVPALRPGTTAGSPVGWVSPQRDAPSEQGYRPGDKVQAAAKEGKANWGLKRTGAPLGNQEAPAEKRTTMGFTLDLLKNIQTASTLNMAADKLLFQSSLQEAPLQTPRPSELWYNHPLTSPKSETSSVSTCGPVAQDQTPARPTGDDASEPVSSLLSDLSKALQEYQEAERKISHLEKEDLPAQRHLWEHLSKIRSELSHIHQALERTARQSDGPLDLSVKRDAANPASVPGARREGAAVPRDNGTETEEEDEELEERRAEGEEDEELEEDEEEESQRKAMKASLESRKQSLDMLIKMSQASVMSAEVLSPAGLGMRPGPAEALWPSRATKCEADSSVLLCPDGRSVVFTDIPSSAKTSKRPASIQRLEAQCPPSPLTTADN